LIQLLSTDSYTNHSAPNHQTKTVTRIQNTEPGEPMYDNFTQRIRLPIDDVSPTIVAGGIRPQFQFGHPTQTRGLTVRERARLQSFPDTFTFETGLTQGRVLTGMAVPPLLAKSYKKQSAVT
jgi:DNA (cytosine-5)-methyltransferase 1